MSTMLTLYLVILFFVLVITLFGATFNGDFKENKKIVHLFFALLTPFFNAICSYLLLNSNGSPLIEWLLPLLCVLFSWTFYRSANAYIVSAITCGLMSCLLSYFFVLLVSANYTTNLHHGSHLAAHLQQLQLKKVYEMLIEKYGRDTVLDPFHIDLTTFNDSPVVKKTSYVKEWHSPITRMYSKRHEIAKLRFTGGKLSECINCIIIE